MHSSLGATRPRASRVYNLYTPQCRRYTYYLAKVHYGHAMSVQYCPLSWIDNKSQSSTHRRIEDTATASCEHGGTVFDPCKHQQWHHIIPHLLIQKFTCYRRSNTSTLLYLFICTLHTANMKTKDCHIRRATYISDLVAMTTAQPLQTRT